MSVVGSIGREKYTTGRNVALTSLLPAAGEMLVTESGMAAGIVRLSVLLVVLPAASMAVTTSVGSPAVSADRSSTWLNEPSALNAIGMVVPPSSV